MKILYGVPSEGMDYGRHFSKFSPDAVKAFLYDLPDFAQAVSRHTQDGNRQVLSEVDRFLAEAASGALEEDQQG